MVPSAPAVGVLVMFAYTASFLSLNVKAKTFGSPVKDQQDVFYIPHLRGLASILAPVLLVLRPAVVALV